MKTRFAILALVLLSAWAHAQWTQTSGPPAGGTINTLASSYARIFAGSYGGGVYYSDNFGANWTRINTGLDNLRIRKLAVHYNRVYAGIEGGGAYTIPVYGEPVWEKIDRTHNMTVSTFAFDRDNIYIGTFGEGILVSSDGGDTWFKTNVGLGKLNVLDIAVFGHNLFAATDDGIFISGNHGDTWFDFSQGLAVRDVYTLAVEGDFLFAGTIGGGVYRLGMDQYAWDPMNTGLENLMVQTIVALDTQLFAGTPAGVFVSLDDGLQWSPASGGLHGANVFALEAGRKGLFAGTLEHGVYLSYSHGKSWKPVNTGLMNASVSTVYAKSARILAGTSHDGLYLSEDHGNTWRPVGPAQLAIRDIVALDKLLFAAAADAGILRSTDDGRTWTVKNAGLPMVSIDHLMVAGLNIYAGTAKGVYRSVDQGETWEYASHGLFDPRIEALIGLGRRLFAGTPDGLYFSVTNGDVWQRINTDLSKADIRSIVIAKDQIFVTTTGQIRLSPDHGRTWNDVTGDLYPHINLLTADADNVIAVHCDPRKFMLGVEEGPTPAEHAETGIYVTKDLGDSWRKANGNLGNTFICSATVQNGMLYAGTDGAGIFYNDELIADRQPAEPTYQIQLFPNPVTQRVSISETGTVDHARLSIYSTSGQLLLSREIEDEVPSIQVSSLASGVYVLRFENGNQVATQIFVKE